jgi:hypothetical protein
MGETLSANVESKVLPQSAGLGFKLSLIFNSVVLIFFGLDG